ncbi:hypothetical protein [Paraburkholderia sacchari]|uniref:Lipoprotein n=2 Tax=Paraburkholderia sacchari TaxID=159450 RepID=A0A8T6ZKV6_9BURK|nr:hypothetical protein [Paraburkholderia sacchari]NLP64309.1 hypothetical protein [Paraburkholderia sacchari]
MNKRKACLVGLAAGATLLAGCVAQYQNPSECEREMRTRLSSASLGALSVTHTAVAYRGKRVVVEGLLDRGALPASGGLSASAAAAVAGAATSASGASAASVSAASMPTSTATSTSTGAATTARGASAPLAASMVSAASGASAASAPVAAPVAEAKPTTPMAMLAVKLGLHKAPRPSTAAECTYDKSGSLTSFRWLSPGMLAKTTPAPDGDDE